MSRVTGSKLWNETAKEVDEFTDLTGGWSGRDRVWSKRNRNRVVDLWVAWSIHSAARAIHLGRYRDNHQLARAIGELRTAAQRVADLMRRDVAARKEESKGP